MSFVVSANEIANLWAFATLDRKATSREHAASALLWTTTIMALIFEFCFYIGALLALVGLVWLMGWLIGRRFRDAAVPLGVLFLGAVLLIGPAIVSHNMAVDLGPRETMVDNERHITLTGWDRQGYDFLSAKSDTIVLQMGNTDVTDATLDFLANMSQLRELDLNDTAVTDVGLAKLTKLPALRTLRLRATRITDSGFREYLATIPSLRQIDLRETSVSVDAVDDWKSAEDGRRAFQ